MEIQMKRSGSETEGKQIKNRYTGNVIFSGAEGATTKETVAAALRAGVSLAEADLRGIDLFGVDLSGANLREANLQGANLSHALLREANLTAALLQGANLREANLQRADLEAAFLQGADLEGADLTGSNLHNAYIHGANLSQAKLPAPSVLLGGPNWGYLSPQLITQLMAWDAANHPNPEAFEAWAKGGPCPYQGPNEGWSRAANFREDPKLWQPLFHVPKPVDLIKAVLAEVCPPWSEEQVKEFETKFAK